MKKLTIAALVLIFLGCSERDKKPDFDRKDWPVYLGGKNSNQYSPLSQITPENVHLLGPAWEYESEGGMPGERTQIQCNPIIIGGVLYGTSPTLKVFALNAATGERFWQFDTTKEKEYARNVNRGVVYWSDGDQNRILFSAG
ncbi:MAG: pyrroloquinoline quinone-dependent dehydrogenase, partial [Prolixibacteraceae bacterium]